MTLRLKPGDINIVKIDRRRKTSQGRLYKTPWGLMATLKEMADQQYREHKKAKLEILKRYEKEEK